MRHPEAIPHIPEADSFQIEASVHAFKQAIRGHIWLVLATVALTIFLVTAYIKVWPPVFQAEVMVASIAEQDQTRKMFYQGWNLFRQDTLSNEGTLMTSGPVLAETIRRLDLKYEDVFHPFSSYVVYLWGNSWIGQNYRKVKSWFFPPEPSPVQLSEDEIEFFKVLKDFRSGVSVQQVGEASIGLLVVKASTPRVSVMANTLVEVYLEQRRERYVEEASQAYNSLKLETDKALAELRQAEAEMTDFYEESGMLLLFEKDRVELGQWLGLRDAVTNLEAQISDNEQALRVVNQQLQDESRALGLDEVFKDNAQKARLTQLETALAEARQTFQPNSPEVREIEEQIALTSKAMQSEAPHQVMRNTQSIQDTFERLRTSKQAIEAELAGARAALETKRAEADRMKAVLDRIPGQMHANHQYERRQSILESTYRSLNEKLIMAAVSKATALSAPPAMRIVEEATTPEKPRWPNTKLLILAALMVGGLAGTLGALLVDLMIMRVNRYRLQRKASGYNLFAVVQQDEGFLKRLYPPDFKAA